MKKYLLILLLVILPVLGCPGAALANSAEPPCFTVIVQQPAGDLTLTLEFPDGSSLAPVALRREDKAWEGYYRFFYHDAAGEQPALTGALLAVESSDKRFTCPLPAETFGYYNNLLTLDQSAEMLTVGQPGWRTPALVGLRVLATLLLEGAVFFCFGYRRRRSWLVFLAVNLLTQGLLNAAITGPLIGGYWWFGYLLGELAVFAGEMLAFALLLREHSKKRAVLCALTANLVSLVAGGWLIANLPV